jgi:hypothetical protein
MGSGFFKTKALEIDRKTMPAILKIYADFLEKEFQPAFYDKIRNDYRGDYQAYVNDIFRKSMFTDSIRYRQIIRKSEKKVSDAIINDPLMDIYRDFSRLLLSGMDKMTDSLNIESAKLYRKYIAGLALMNPGKTLYPDANFTMRLSYGKIEGYQPLDAEVFSYYTTLDGIMEKEDPEISDYKVPVLLKDLYRKRDFAPYGVNNSLPVCFTASNHTSGGNSGSPVLNADGNLIGINFDRNWEGTVSDFYYDPLVCRNISLDIRYVLFIIDKYANADWLLNELTIINE